MTPMPRWKRRIYFYTMVIVFVFIVPVIALYSTGYRLDENFSIVQTGGIHVSAPMPNALMTIGDERYKRSGTFYRDWFVQNLTPGTYTVRVSKESYWTWSKEITVKEQEVANAFSFMVPKDPEIEEIDAVLIQPPESAGGATTTIANPRFEELQTAFRKAKQSIEEPATRTSTSSDARASAYDQVSPDESVALWRKHNQLFATWLEDERFLPRYFCRDDVCEKTVVVHFSFSPITYFDFFPGRSDITLVATQHSVFAIEIDKRGTQNIQPVYKGESPTFIVENGTVYIEDNGRIFSVSLS